MFNKISDLTLLIVFVLSMMSITVVMKVYDYKGQTTCISKGYPTYKRVISTRYCSKVENGSSVIVALDNIR